MTIPIDLILSSMRLPRSVIKKNKKLFALSPTAILNLNDKTFEDYERAFNVARDAIQMPGLEAKNDNLFMRIN